MAHRIASLLAFTALSAAAAGAQPAPTEAIDTADDPTDAGSTTVFTPADFTRFSPQTARDMVNEVPGFSLQGTEQARGLGQATSNVLINGERLTGKSNDAINALGRIPADRVVRIELVEASTLGIPGLSGRVVNVVTDGSGISGVWNYEVRFRRRLEPRYNQGEASLSGETGDFNWTLGIESNGNRFGNKGPELISDPFGNQIERRQQEFIGYSGYLEGSASLGWTPPSGHEANLSATYAIFNRTSFSREDRLPAEGDGLFRVFRGGEDEWNSEISGDYAIPALGGSLKLIGYFRHEDSRVDNQVEELTLDRVTPFGGVRFDQDFIENEAIVRTEYDWSTGTGRDWQAAFETAYNRLDSGSSFFTIDPDRIFTLDNRSTPVIVDETRYDVSLTHTRKMTPKFTLQASLAGELSELASEVGDDVLQEDFVRPKGYVSGTYEFSDDLITTLRIDREVGQLSFFDFVSSQDLNNENEEGGNRDLVPNQTWRGELEIDRKYGAFGASTITLFHEEIEDLVDQVPLAGGLTGPGNLDSARRSGIEVDATLTLDPIGLNGVQVQLIGEAQQSSVDDPLTGQSRWISNDKVAFVFAEIRWDVPNTPYAVEVAYEQYRGAQTFRIDEINAFRGVPGFAWVQFEHKDVFGANAFIRFANLLDQKDTGERLIFSPDRTGAVLQRQSSERDFGPILLVGVSGNF